MKIIAVLMLLIVIALPIITIISLIYNNITIALISIVATLIIISVGEIIFNKL